MEDILLASDNVLAYSAGYASLEEFRENRMAVDAVFRNLEVIGEAVKRP